MLGKVFLQKNLATMKLPDFRNTAKPLCLRWAKPHADIFRCTAEAFAAPTTQGLSFFRVLGYLANKC
jgi:hypothetical protein